ncbi:MULTISPECIES: hypothetical protein [Peribacillus]|uniref:hypothetical protein n=1 Tax=Peribacillus TaxID=2675229 RepID=UPI0010711352|nr:hypothetical protein [Peribacillus frigoritolerans]MEC0345284.1 hypothetical protein [Peribacillus castrilensis]TFH62680.1 hypothetical protein E4J71_02435 [Peribacillus frigoritolerans]
MGYHNYYLKCRQGVGRPVEIGTKQRNRHRGIIHRVTPNRVHIRPLGDVGNLGGFGYGGFNAGYGWGAANGFAFGAIASLVFLAFLW